METLHYPDTPVDLVIDDQPCRYAPLRMEWAFGDRRDSLHAQEIRLALAPPIPGVLQIQMTNDCNLRCRYCAHFFNPKRGTQKYIDDAEVVMLEEEIRRLPPQGLVILMGGEPFMAPDALFRFVEASPVTVVIFTNGTLLTPGYLDRLRGTRAVLLLSVDGNPETTSLHRYGKARVPATEEMFRGLELVRDSGIPFGIAMVITRQNLPNLVEQVEYLRERYRPGSIGVSTPHYTKYMAMDPMDTHAIARAYVDLFHLSRKNGLYIDQIARRLDPLVKGKPLLRDCSAGGNKRVYHPGGDWRNCTNNTNPREPMDTWSHYIPVLTPSCHGCIGIGVCGGGCIADAKALNPGGFDERYCETVRALVRAFLGFCATEPALQSTNRSELGRLLGHLLQRGDKGSNFSAGHVTSDLPDPAIRDSIRRAIAHTAS